MGSPVVEVDFKKIIKNGFDPVVICVLTSRVINIMDLGMTPTRTIKTGETACVVEYSSI